MSTRKQQKKQQREIHHSSLKICLRNFPASIASPLFMWNNLTREKGKASGGEKLYSVVSLYLIILKSLFKITTTTIANKTTTN